MSETTMLRYHCFSFLSQWLFCNPNYEFVPDGGQTFIRCKLEISSKGLISWRLHYFFIRRHSSDRFPARSLTCCFLNLGFLMPQSPGSLARVLSGLRYHRRPWYKEDVSRWHCLKWNYGKCNPILALPSKESWWWERRNWYVDSRKLLSLFIPLAFFH